MSSIEDLYRKELLNILNENKVSYWVDAGGGNDPGIHRNDYDSIKNIQLVSLLMRTAILFQITRLLI